MLDAFFASRRHPGTKPTPVAATAPPTTSTCASESLIALYTPTAADSLPVNTALANRVSMYSPGEARKSLAAYMDSDSYSFMSESDARHHARKRDAGSNADSNRGGFLASVWALGTTITVCCVDTSREVVNDVVTLAAGFARERRNYAASVASSAGMDDFLEDPTANKTEEEIHRELDLPEGEYEIVRIPEIENMPEVDGRVWGIRYRSKSRQDLRELARPALKRTGSVTSLKETDRQSREGEIEKMLAEARAIIDSLKTPALPIEAVSSEPTTTLKTHKSKESVILADDDEEEPKAEVSETSDKPSRPSMLDLPPVRSMLDLPEEKPKSMLDVPDEKPKSMLDVPDEKPKSMLDLPDEKPKSLLDVPDEKPKSMLDIPPVATPARKSGEYEPMPDVMEVDDEEDISPTNTRKPAPQPESSSEAVAAESAAASDEDKKDEKKEQKPAARMANAFRRRMSVSNAFSPFKIKGGKEPAAASPAATSPNATSPNLELTPPPTPPPNIETSSINTPTPKSRIPFARSRRGSVSAESALEQFKSSLAQDDTAPPTPSVQRRPSISVLSIASSIMASGTETPGKEPDTPKRPMLRRPTFSSKSTGDKDRRKSWFLPKSDSADPTPTASTPATSKPPSISDAKPKFFRKPTIPTFGHKDESSRPTTAGADSALEADSVAESEKPKMRKRSGTMGFGRSLSTNAVPQGEKKKGDAAAKMKGMIRASTFLGKAKKDKEKRDKGKGVAVEED